jgi:hypothetical protein
VRALIPNPEGLIRPGMLLTVTVSAHERRALAVPELSLIPLGGKQFVYRVGAGNAVEQVEVKLGARRAGVAEVNQRPGRGRPRGRGGHGQPARRRQGRRSRAPVGGEPAGTAAATN